MHSAFIRAFFRSVIVNAGKLHGQDSPFLFLLSEKQPLKNENLYEKERSVFHYQPCSFIEIVIIALKM